jgi:hypothetical protein
MLKSKERAEFLNQKTNNNNSLKLYPHKNEFNIMR